MTEHKYYECDICGTTAKKMNVDSLKRRVRNLAEELIENTNVKHVCHDCTNEITNSAMDAIEERRNKERKK